MAFERPHVKSPGHVALALTFAAFGIMSLVNGDITPLWNHGAVSIPARSVVGYACGIILLLAGIGLLWQRTAATSARTLLGAFSLWLLAVNVPALFTGINVGTTWPAAQSMVFVAASWVLCAWFAGLGGLRIARAVLYGGALIPFGLAHFLYVDATTVLIPHWIPFHTAWAYITGAAFIAAGLGILAHVCARWAAILSTIMIGAFTLIIWVPRMITGNVTPFQRGEAVVSWALTAAAWVIAESYRRA